MKMLFFLLAISFCSIIRESFKEEGEEVGVEEVEKGERAREGGIWFDARIEKVLLDPYVIFNERSQIWGSMIKTLQAEDF